MSELWTNARRRSLAGLPRAINRLETLFWYVTPIIQTRGSSMSAEFGVPVRFDPIDASTMPSLADNLSPALGPIYLRCIADISSEAVEVSSSDLSAREVLRAHFLIADHFLRCGEGDGIGGIGPKSTDLLLSAVARQNVEFGGIAKWTTIFQKAATILFGLVMNHPFHDANKRTAYLSTVHYFHKNGYLMTASERELEDFTVEIAGRSLKKYPRYRDLRKTSTDPEVEFIAYWLRKKTRKADRTEYLVTYRELNNLLAKYGASLENPHDNSIDVMRVEDVIVRPRAFWRKAETIREKRRVCVLGFPGWSKQVGKGRIGHLRKELGLTPENGVDSQSFFNGIDDMKVLIDIYEGALRRLADR